MSDMSMEVDRKEATDQSIDHAMDNPQSESVVTTSTTTHTQYKHAEQLTEDYPQNHKELDRANTDYDTNRSDGDVTEENETLEVQSELSSATESKTETRLANVVDQTNCEESEENDINSTDCDRRGSDETEKIESQPELSSGPESKPEIVGTEAKQPNCEDEQFYKENNVTSTDFDRRGSEGETNSNVLTALESKQDTTGTEADQPNSEEQHFEETEAKDANSTDSDTKSVNDDATDETETNVTSTHESKSEITEAIVEQPNSEKNEAKDINSADSDTRGIEDDVTVQTGVIELQSDVSSPPGGNSEPVGIETDQPHSEEQIPEANDPKDVHSRSSDRRESDGDVTDQTETDVTSASESESEITEAKVEQPNSEKNEAKDINSTDSDTNRNYDDVTYQTENDVTSVAERKPETTEDIIEQPNSEKNGAHDINSTDSDTKGIEDDVTVQTGVIELQSDVSSPPEGNSEPVGIEADEPHSEDQIPEENDANNRYSDGRESDSDVIDQIETNESNLEISSAPESNLKPTGTETDQPNFDEQFWEENYQKDVSSTKDKNIHEQEDKDEKTTENTSNVYTLRTESEIVTFSPTPEEPENVDKRGRDSDSPVGEERTSTQEAMPRSTTKAQPEVSTSSTSDVHSSSAATSEIKKSTQSVNQMKNDLQNLFLNAEELLKNYNKKLNSKPLKEFVDQLDNFREDFDSLKDAYTQCEDVSNTINKQLNVLRQTTNDICNVINRKFREEDLSNWVDLDTDAESRKDQLKEERKAHEKAAQAKASQARAETAKAATSVSESNQFASQAEAEAIEAEFAAKAARDLADDAIQAAEETKLAAEEKRKVEEEAKRRAKEKEEQKAEEERRKKEEEERKLAEEAKKKGTSVESERHRKAQEKQLRETERKNPKNWPRYIYSTDGGDYDSGIGCIIRAIDGSLSRDDVEMKRIDQLSGLLELRGNEELISNIIEVTPVDTEKKFKFEEPFSLAIPHCAPRSGLGREPVIKMLNKDGQWTELQTNDAYFEDIKEMRFVETRSKTFGIFVVIYRIKRDSLTLSYMGGKVTSSVDSRVSFMAKPLGKKINTNFTLEVQHVDQAIVQDLRYRKPAECGALITCSPILNLKVSTKTFRKPVTVTLPVPHNQSRIKRPATSVTRNKRGAETNGRPQTAKPTQYDKEEEEATDQIHLFSKCDGEWVTAHHIPLIQPKNKDIVTFEMDEPFERFFVIRTRVEITALQLEKLAPLIEEAVTLRPIKIFLRQQGRDLQNIVLSCANTSKVDKALRHLAEEGYDDGPPPSRDVLVKEGQVMEIGFRGNLKPETNDFSTKFVFNTHFSSKVNFRVVELDRFAQKGIDSYRGFAQVFTKGLMSKMILLDERDKSRGFAQAYKPPASEMMEGHFLLCDLLMSIPKPDPEPPKPLNTAPVLLKADGPVNNDMLWHIAQEIGDDWKKLAQYLCVKRMRIQAIMRQHFNDDNTKKIYDMLTTWSKRLPTSVDRVDMLCYALTSCGRGDLSVELQDKREEFRRQRAYSARASYLHKAFVRISREPRVTGNWRVLGRRLGLSEEEMDDIESARKTSYERCYYCLQRWREHQGDEATLALLSNSLRQARYRGLAREIQTVA